MNSGRIPINITDQVAQKIEVDHQIPIKYYYNIADDLLNQVNDDRQKKNMIDHYILLLRLSSLLTETIPTHPDYDALKEKRCYQRAFLNVLDELESLRPEVEQNQLNISERSTPINVIEATQKLHVDHRIPLPYYYATADDILKQANEHYNIIDRYILFIRYASLLSETIPAHKDYNALTEHKFYKRAFVDVLDKLLESIRPEAEQEIDKVNRELHALRDAAHEALPECLNLSCPVIPDIVPSAPPIENLVIDDTGLMDSSTSTTENLSESSEIASLCILCYDAPKEGACVPCGHVAGCITCLNQSIAKSWGCPVCRTKIELVEMAMSLSNVKVNHGVLVSLQTPPSKENPETQFLSCPLYKKKSCQFFRWRDGEIDARSKFVIPRLVDKLKEMEQRLAIYEGERKAWDEIEEESSRVEKKKYYRVRNSKVMFGMAVLVSILSVISNNIDDLFLYAVALV